MIKLSYKNYNTNSLIFADFGDYTKNFQINFDGLSFENQKELKNYIEKTIVENLAKNTNEVKEIQKIVNNIENLKSIIFDISIYFQNYIKQ